MTKPAPSLLTRQMRHQARQQAARAIAGTDGTADTRARRQIETIQAGVYRTEIEGHDPLDSLGLTVPQHNAATYLRGLWRDALPAYEAPGGYGSGGAGRAGERHLTHDEYLAAARAWADYKRAMSELHRRAGHVIASAVRAMVLDEQPAHPAHVRDGLHVLAVVWKYC